jgi:hypothetical protein
MNNDSSHSSILKLSMGSVTSNPMSDKDLFLKENKKFYKIITVFMIIDFILNELIILNDNIVLYFMTSGNKELKIFFFILFTIILMIIFGSILFLLSLKKLTISKIIRFFYLIFGALYSIYQIVIKFIELSENDFPFDPFNILVFVIISLSVIPKIIGFMYMKIYEGTIGKIDDANRAEEQQHFIEKVENKFDRSTTNNMKEVEYEKELDKEMEEDEKIYFTMNNNKIISNNIASENKTERKEEEKNEQEEEEVDNFS